MEERFELARERIKVWLSEREGDELPDNIRDYMYSQALLLDTAVAVFKNPDTMASKETNRLLYSDIAGEGYAGSFTNPDVCAERFKDYGEKTAGYLCFIAADIREVITAAYEQLLYPVVIRIELFLELYRIIKEHIEPEKLSSAVKELITYYIHDYDEPNTERNIKDLVTPDDESLIYRLVMKTDHGNTDYLYRYGEYITDNEIRLSAYLSSLSEEKLADMAKTYTEGYKKGFELAGIDLKEKKTVEIRYPIGFEPVVKQAVFQFEKMGLKPVFRRRTNAKAIGVVSPSYNKQYVHDHRYDDAIWLNRNFVAERLKHAKKSFEKYKKEAKAFAGPAVIEYFGDELFVPKNSSNALRYGKEQESISVEYMRDYALLQNEYIREEERSFTIISYPIPAIGDRFEDIFTDTVRINNLDQDMYLKIHQCLIDALDMGEYVRILGKNNNRTDIRVMLHKLDDPEHQTNFENCLADVNIPVGEVFTSPVLTGTEGVLHVSWVYLNGLRYDDLCLRFKDGRITEYECANYDDPDEGKKYIKENILKNHETLPIGEFAIGTNTTAYTMGRKYGIEAKLPILIAEKTGPHFAVGDTCYSMREDIRVYNPDGKEIIARDNECSINRKTDPEKAYFQCHTDITIPFEELGRISVFTKDGKEIIIIDDGLFVLSGTEALNEALTDTNTIQKG